MSADASRPERLGWSRGAVRLLVLVQHAHSRVSMSASPFWGRNTAILTGVSAGRIPANVSVNARASVTAGLAKEVKASN
jgi:hypothetical protein